MTVNRQQREHWLHVALQKVAQARGVPLSTPAESAHLIEDLDADEAAFCAWVMAMERFPVGCLVRTCTTPACVKPEHMREVDGASE